MFPLLYIPAIILNCPPSSERIPILPSFSPIMAASASAVASDVMSLIKCFGSSASSSFCIALTVSMPEFFSISLESLDSSIFFSFRYDSISVLYISLWSAVNWCTGAVSVRNTGDLRSPGDAEISMYRLSSSDQNGL